MRPPVRPPKRRVPRGQVPPPPWQPAPMGPAERLGEDVRAWRRGESESPSWMRSVTWTIVIAMVVPVVLGALHALSN